MSKAIGSADVSRATIDRIETAALWAWPPRETALVDGWLLRAGNASSRRLNSAATRHFDKGANLEQSIAKVEAWYAKRGMPPCFHLADGFAPASLDALLASRGWCYLTPTDVMTSPPDEGWSVAHEIVLEMRPTALAMNALAAREWSPLLRAARAAVMARIRRPLVFAVAISHGEPVAGGLCVVDGPLAGIFAMRTQPGYERRGYARSIMARLAAWAAGMGANELYLQVEQGNAPALGLYRSLGFVWQYGYHYRQLGLGKA